jgi:Kelch motif
MAYPTLHFKAFTVLEPRISAELVRLAQDPNTTPAQMIEVWRKFGESRRIQNQAVHSMNFYANYTGLLDQLCKMDEADADCRRTAAELVNIIPESEYEPFRATVARAKTMLKHVSLETASAADQMLKDILEPLRGKQSDEITAVIAEAYAVRGQIAMMLGILHFKELTKAQTDDEMAGYIIALQTLAPMVAHYSHGWLNSPESLCIRGTGQFLRFDFSEAASDISAGLTLGGRLGWININIRNLAEEVLELTRRKQVPCIGTWRQIASFEPSSRRGRYGCGTCQVGTKMYSFGGLHSHRTNPFLGDASDLVLDLAQLSEMQASNELYMFDLETEAWAPVAYAPSGYCPAPRGYSSLAYYKEQLFMYGGRETYGPTGGLFYDLWRFELAGTSRRWTKIAGSHPRINQAASHGIYKDVWCFVHTDDDGEPMVNIYNIISNKWSTPVIRAGPAPPFKSDRRCSSWIVDNRLYIWAKEVELEDNNFHGTLWYLEISADYKHASWYSHAHVGPALSCDRGALKGGLSLPYCETASAMDPTTGLVYLFGGWNDDLNWYTAMENGALTCLRGRYNRVLLELNMTDLCVRTVETVSNPDDELGPSLRAEAMIAAYKGRVAVMAGYTTLDPEEFIYRDVRALDDCWVCSVLSKRLAKVLDPLSVDNPHRISLREVDTDGLFTNASNAIIHSLELRKAVSALVPQSTRGALICHVCNEGGLPKPLDQLFVGVSFIPVAQVLDMYSGMAEHFPEEYRRLMNYDIAGEVFVLFVSITGLDDPPYQLGSGCYGRYYPGMIYMSKEVSLAYIYICV